MRRCASCALRGAGKDFCAGMDLQELLESAEHSVEQNRAAALRFGGLFVRMRALPKPVVAVVSGRALAGGCGLATACDLVVAGGVGAVRLSGGAAGVRARARHEHAATHGGREGRVRSRGHRPLCSPPGRPSGSASCRASGRTPSFEEQAGQLLRSLAGFSASALALTKQQFYRLDGAGFEEGCACRRTSTP